MTFEEAIKKSIQSYYAKGDDEWEYSKLEKDRVYNKKYFDDFEEEVMSKKTTSTSKKKTPVKKDVSEI